MSTDDTASRLLNAAGPIFAEKGYQNATVREICAAAGVNLASVNYYFRDKERKGYLTADQLPEAGRDAFKAADVKNDGRLSLQEEVNALLKDFEAADVDNDRTLTYEELVAYVKRSSR